MAFKFVPVEAIKKTVNVEIPGDFGKTTKADFEAKIKKLGVSQARELIQAIQNKEIDEETVIRENIVDLKGVKDADGNEIEFSQELLAQMSEVSYVRGPMLAAIFEVNFNLEKLRAKNS